MRTGNDGRGLLIKDQTPTMIVGIVIFVVTLLLLIAVVTYHKIKDEKTLILIKKELREKDSLISANQAKDEKIAKLTSESKDASILQRKLSSVLVEKDTAISHAAYWQARHGLVKVVLRRERAKNKDASVSQK